MGAVTYVVANVELCVAVDEKEDSVRVVVDGGQVNRCVALLSTQTDDVTTQTLNPFTNNVLCCQSNDILQITRIH